MHWIYTQISDQNTISKGVELLQTWIESSINNPKNMELIFQQIQNQIQSSKQTNKKELISLLSHIARVNPPKISVHTDKIISIFQAWNSEDVSSLFSFISKTFGETTKILIQIDNSTSEVRQIKLSNDALNTYSLFKDFCLNNIKNPNKYNQILGTLCLTAFIESCSYNYVNPDNWKMIFGSLSEQMDKVGFHAKLEWLNCWISWIFTSEDLFKPYATMTVYRILDYLNDSDWWKRKLSLNVIYTLVYYCGEEWEPIKDYIKEFLFTWQGDRVKEVSDVCKQILKMLGESQTDFLCEKAKSDSSTNSVKLSKKEKDSKVKGMTSHNSSNLNTGNNGKSDNKMVNNSNNTITEYVIKDHEMKLMKANSEVGTNWQVKAKQDSNAFKDHNSHTASRGRSKSPLNSFKPNFPERCSSALGQRMTAPKTERTGSLPRDIQFKPNSRKGIPALLTGNTSTTNSLAKSIDIKKDVNLMSIEQRFKHKQKTNRNKPITSSNTKSNLTSSHRGKATQSQSINSFISNNHIKPKLDDSVTKVSPFTLKSGTIDITEPKKELSVIMQSNQTESQKEPTPKNQTSTKVTSIDNSALIVELQNQMIKLQNDFDKVNKKQNSKNKIKELLLENNFEAAWKEAIEINSLNQINYIIKRMQMVTSAWYYNDFKTQTMNELLDLVASDVWAIDKLYLVLGFIVKYICLRKMKIESETKKKVKNAFKDIWNKKGELGWNKNEIDNLTLIINCFNS